VEENENALEEKKRELSRAREAFEECSSRFAALAAELAKLDTHGEHLDDRDAVLEGELAEIERAQAAKRFEQAETQARAARLAASLAELEDRLRALARELETLDIEREALRERDAALSVEIESVRSGLALLRGFRETYEGYGSGARALLSRHDGLAALADSIHPKDSDLLPAIESALEGVIQYVVAPSSGAALDAVQSLRGGAGRATLVDLSGFREASGGRRYEPMPVDGAILGPVRSFLEVSGDLRFVLDELLSRSVIVETLEDAVRLARQPQWRGYRFVARNGDWAEHPGLIHGGSTDGSGGTRILGRGDRIEELDERVTELECDRARARERLEELALERSARLAEQGTSLAEREAAREALSREDKCLERFATELSSGEGRLLTVRGEREGLLGRRDELGAKRDSLQAGARAAEEEKTRLEEARQLRESELIRASQALDLAREASHDLTLRVQRAVAEIEKLSLEILRVEESRVSDEAATRLRREELVAADRALGELARDLEEGLELFGLKAKALEEKRHLRDAVARERAEALEQLRLLEEECRRWTRARDQAQELVHENEMKLQKLELGCAELISRVEREFEVELLSPATRESYGALLDVDEETLETARHEREELRKQVERMGAVNLVALDQFDRESRRLAFLQTQKDDLEAAREKLRRAIRKINRTARRHFMETLEQVRVNFQTTFGTLFEGGHSDIRLANDEDPLEAPIEIFARPRGKRLSNISLLSSGERSLTAVAFLFAIYLVKPSPFCILDEVDAPLDDANIGRFLSMLKKVAERTQFVMITHNKKTMEVADYLYGVTMEEPGVSKLVSVRLGTEDRSLPSLEPPGESSASEAEKELVMEGSA
jgi:chromosome segregation protein